MQNNKSNRRDFLKYSLTALLALNYGCSVKGLFGKEKKAASTAGFRFNNFKQHIFDL